MYVASSTVISDEVFVSGFLQSGTAYSPSSVFKIAESEHLPLCQDTGFAVWFVEYGTELQFDKGDIYEALNEFMRKNLDIYFIENPTESELFLNQVLVNKQHTQPTQAISLLVPEMVSESVASMSVGKSSDYNGSEVNNSVLIISPTKKQPVLLSVMP